MAKVQPKTFGVVRGRKPAKPKPAPVKRVYDTESLNEVKVSYIKHPISASIIDDENLLAKEFHRAVSKWQDITGLDHYGRVYVETESTGELIADENGITALAVRLYVVVETAPEFSAR